MTEPAGPAGALRYAVLHHTGHGPPHYDLLFETSSGSDLLTFRSPAWPVTEASRLKRLPDHRPVYLEYEGPISGDRGEVRAVARGTCDVLRDGSTWLVTFRTGSRHPPLRISDGGRVAAGDR